MKKLLCLILALAVVIASGSISLAGEGGSSNAGPGVSGAPAVNVESATYGEPATGITDGGSPAGGTDAGGKGGDTDGAADKGGLPKTGGIPAEVFYAAGALFVVAALILSGKRATSKNR